MLSDIDLFGSIHKCNGGGKLITYLRQLHLDYVRQDNELSQIDPTSVLQEEE